MRRMVREWSIRAAMLGVSLLLALGLAEAMVRVFFPIYDGRNNVTLQGEPIKDWFVPGTAYRQVSNEYDALTTITDKGHRVPRVVGNPDVIFIGDSFTYGYGLKDDETFPSIYCGQRHIECANLGLPSSGTAKQLQRLEKFLDDFHWQPKEVKLFFFGMSSSLSAGNDFVDNFNYGRWRKAQSNGGTVPAAAAPRRGMAARLIGSQRAILAHSHLMRRVKYNWGPLLKSTVLNDPGTETMAEALVYTGQALKELDELSRRAGFTYHIYLIVPVQDVMRGSHPDTLAALNRVSPRPVTTTAPLFVESPQSFYYSYDGHLNPKGSRRIAELLISQDSDKSDF